MRRAFVGVLPVLAVLTVETVQAQGVTTGALSGIVRDSEGLPLPGVRVSATDGRTGRSVRTLTNEAGRYYLPYLQPGGPYALDAERSGYGSVTRSEIRVQPGQTVRIDVRLTPGPIEMPELSVEIAKEPVFGSTRTAPQTTLDALELSSFPTVGRQITDYALLSPLVVAVRDGLSVGGQNFRYNSIRIDGALNHDLFGLTDSGIPGGEGDARAISVEAIESLQILTAPFDVRHSGFTGGAINAVTRSGTNRWQGSVFGYHINDAWVSEPAGARLAEFEDSRFGWTLGGPLLRDRAFFFTNGEFQLQSTPAPGPSVVPGGALDAGARQAGVHPDSAQRFIDILDRLGFGDIGTTGPISLENPRANLFARVDLMPDDRTRLTVRHSYSRTGADQPPSRSLSGFRLSSGGRRFTGNTHSTLAHLFSRLGERWSNEAILNLQWVRLDRNPLAAFPLVQVDVTSEIDGELVTRTLGAGADEIAQVGNALDQDIFQLTDHLTGVFGRHELTFGIHNELFRFRDRFLPLGLGTFRFESLAALEENRPAFYAVNTPDIVDPSVRWSLISPGGYAQDAWNVNERLTLTLGLRVDVPIFLDAPEANPEFERAFGFSTARAPGPRPRIQPRVGFNWRTTGRTQVRGGIGLFAGRPSFVWLSNAFRNTGNAFAFLACPGPVAPPLRAGDFPESPPGECVDGTSPSPQLTTVDLLDPDFGFPLDLKASLGIDRQLPGDFSATAQILFTRSVERPFLEEVNLVESRVGRDSSQGGRPLFGQAAPDGFDPVRKTDEFAHVVRLTNRGGDRALLLTLALQRRMADGLRLRTSYTYSDVKDRQPLFFPLAPFGFAANPIRGNPNRPNLVTSPFARKHSVVASASRTWTLGAGFELSLTPQFFATSGAPYSYTVQGDVNGDGYPSDAPRIGRDNDLIYVPLDPTQLAFRNASDAASFDAFIESEPCLRRQRGRLLEAYSCFGPWRHRWDLRGSIGLPVGGDHGGLELVFDLINVFATPFERPVFIDRGISVLRLAGRVDDDPGGQLLFDYVGPPDRAGVLERLNPESQRMFQAGIRYRFE